MTAPWPMMPGSPKPSILDRLAARLFPLGNYTGLLQPDQQQGLQRQGLLNVGLNLLQAGGGQPQQRGTLANIGSAIQGVDVNQAAQQALQLQAYRNQQTEQRAIADVASHHPIKPGMTRDEIYNSQLEMLNELMTIPGGAAIAEKWAPVIQATKPPTPDRARWSFQTIMEHGEPQLYRVNEDTGVKYLVGMAKPAPGTTPKEPTPVERVAASQYESASSSIARMREIAVRNPAAVQSAVAAIKAGRWGKLGTLYSEARGALTDPDAQNFFTEYQNMLLTVTPTYGASRPTAQLMDLEKGATLPAIGSGDFASAFSHMEARLRDLQAKAGRAMPPMRPHPRNPFAEGGAHFVP